MGKERIGWIPVAATLRSASTRLRCHKIVRALLGIGVSAEVFVPSRARDYSCVVFSKRYSTQDVEMAERLKSEGRLVVFDLCDNHLYGAEAGERTRSDGLLRMLTIADRIVFATDALREEIARAVPELASRCVAVIPDPLDDDVAGEAGRWWRAVDRGWSLRQLETWLSDHAARLRLCWFGAHGVKYAPGGMRDLSRIVPSLNRCHDTVPISLTVISNSRDSFRGTVSGMRFPACYLEWAPETFERALRLHDVCVIPVDSNRFTRCKTNNRPATALINNLEVIADLIPSYQDLEPHIYVGAWQDSLKTIAGLSQEQRLKRAQEAKAYLNKRYSLADIAASWLSVLRGSSS